MDAKWTDKLRQIKNEIADLMVEGIEMDDSVDVAIIDALAELHRRIVYELRLESSR